LIPFHSEHFLFVEVGKYIHNRIEESNAENATDNAINDNNEDVKDNKRVDLQPQHNIAKRALLKYAKWANNAGPVKMEIPFNRFIAFSASYLCFLLIIVTLIIKPIFLESYADEQDLKNNTILRWTNWHYVILFYVLALLEKDFEHFYRVKSLQRVLSNFWRFYDLTFHLFFLFYLVMRMVLQTTSKVDHCIGLGTTKMVVALASNNTHSNESDSFESDCWIVQTTLSVSGVLFAIGKSYNYRYMNIFGHIRSTLIFFE